MREKCLFVAATTAVKSVCGVSLLRATYIRVPSPTNESSKWCVARTIALLLLVICTLCPIKTFK